MQAGYTLLETRREAEACTLWLSVWEQFKPRFRPDMKSIGEAEKVFRSELERNRRSPRALFGLVESLKGQEREYEAGRVREEFQSVWKKADAPLRAEDLF